MTTVYHLLTDGALLVETLTEPFGDLPTLPRLGLVATLDASYTDYCWYGLGPHETYPDRRLAQASHREALPTSAGAYVSLDARQSGLGNKSCGPETLPQYLVQPLPAHFVFSLHPGGQTETMRADITDLLELSEQITEHSGPLSEAPAERSTYQDPSDPDARAAIGMEP